MKRSWSLLEDAVFAVLVALSVGLSGALWLSLPNPDVVKAQSSVVAAPSVEVSPETPILIGWSSSGRLGGVLPDDPGFALLWKEVRLALADARPLSTPGVALDEIRSRTQVLAVEMSPGLTLSTIVPWAPSVDGEILVAGGSRPLAVVVSPAGDAAALIQSREAAAVFAALPRTARPVVNAKSGPTPFLPIPAQLLRIGPIPAFRPPPAPTLVGAFFSEPLMVWSISEAGGVTSYTDGKAVLRRYPSGAFTYTSPAAAPFSAADPVSLALSYVAEHPGFPPGMEAYSQETWGSSSGPATTIGLVPEVDGVPLIGGTSASLTLYGTKVGEATLTLVPQTPAGASVTLSAKDAFASLPPSARQEALEAVPAVQMGAKGAVAGLDVLLASGRELFVPGPAGGGS